MVIYMQIVYNDAHLKDICVYMADKVLDLPGLI